MRPSIQSSLYGIAIAGLAGLALSTSVGARPERVAGRATSLPAATQIGEPVDCIQLSRVRNTRVLDDYTIDFEMTGGKVYRNNLPHRCPGLGFEESFSHRTSINQLCSVDIIRVLGNTGGGFDERAACGLGDFTPIELEKTR